MTEGQVFGARRNPAAVVDRRDERQPNYYLDWAYDETKKLIDSFPKSIHDRVFTVRLAIDVNLQKKAETTVENMLKQYGRDYGAKQAAVALMETDGAVRALVGGRDYTDSQFNRATDALRQPGSSFKPYVYAAALTSGFGINSVVVDSPVCIGNWCPKNYEGQFSGPMTLTQAIVRSINVIPVKLSIAIGDGNAKAGRAIIRDLAHKAGIRTSLLPDTPSMPIGANEVTVLDHTGGYGIFVNEGKSITPHAILEVRNGAGELLWRFDRDGPKPKQVITPQVAHDMSIMMSKVVEEGTGRRAMLDGVKAAGKTGTTNAYRDAWFVGFTGNYIAGVWYGNDDYASMNRMTGGALPAMTWHDIMTYAHQGIELKPIPGVNSPPLKPARVAAAGKNEAAQRPALLTRRGADVLVRVERLMDDATRALAARDGSSNRADADDAPRPARPNTFASTYDRPDGGPIRGN
jgi:penicillin-binding protein 1A